MYFTSRENTSENLEIIPGPKLSLDHIAIFVIISVYTELYCAF